MTFAELSQYLYELPRVTKKNTPEESDAFYTFLGRPSEQRQIVHIAGTNGKGSTAVYLESLLKAAGYRVGLFTSPHLISMTERMRVDGTDISEEDFIEVYEAIAATLKVYQKEHDYYPTFFEWMFFIAMLWYEKKGPQVVILETGLGGRLDTTNLVREKAVTVITKIALDHTQYLGDTVDKIAVEKAGIMRPGTPVVFYAEDSLVTQTLWEWAKIMKSPAYLMPPVSCSDITLSEAGIAFPYSFHFFGNAEMVLKTKALYQADNASLALKAGEILLGKQLTKEMAKDALQNAFWPCRMEEILPGIVIDGGHNPDGISALLKSVEASGGKNLLLFAVVNDKDYASMLELIADSGLFAEIILTAVPGPRKTEGKELLTIACEKGVQASYIEDAGEAFAQARKIKQEEHFDTLYVAGSLYLAGNIRNIVLHEG
ncbi:MAG: hypothetical protein MJ105_01530 [Lachnospiraceae bacterium]|nr:hypothetical protein [Lachnospiraceae bacterium]